VASAGPYANHLHLAPDRQPHQHLITQFLLARCSSWHPANSVKVRKAFENHLLTVFCLCSVCIPVMDGQAELIQDTGYIWRQFNNTARKFSVKLILTRSTLATSLVNCDNSSTRKFLAGGNLFTMSNSGLLFSHCWLPQQWLISCFPTATCDLDL